MLNRRRFSILSLVGWFAPDISLARTELSPAAAMVREPIPSSYDIGLRYIDQHPDERNIHLLVCLLEESGVRFTSASQTAQHASLVATIRREFNRGETIAIAGWILSRSEARNFALETLRKLVSS